ATGGAIMGLAPSDAGVTNVVAKNGNRYTVTLSGTAAAGHATVDEAVFGTGLTGNFYQVTMQIPGVNLNGNYTVKQTNATLSNCPSDPNISQVDDEWVKQRSYTGQELADGFAVLLDGNKSGATIQLFAEAGYIDGASPAITTV